MNGFTDKPVTKVGEDIFGVTQYISGLSSFIRECNTPMTIAIQGDWGSGKTSMMNMVREQLGEDVVATWFNTWQYSQFNMGDVLSLSLLSRLIEDLGAVETEKNASAQKALKTIVGVIKKAGVIAVDHVIGGEAANYTKELMSGEEKEVDLAQAINDLKKQFQETVNAKLKETSKERLVIFIDDLDRLNPGKAVELLEVLKLFLDCDNCVFVLAIDYEVVSQGVKQKYGDLIGEEKGRNFFDKIIQVPFKMPVAQYDIRNYVLTAMRDVGITAEGVELDLYVKLIQTSVGCNPRAMKRLFNAFLLLNKVASGSSIAMGRERSILFAVLCMQLSFESIYNYVVKNQKDCCEGNLLQDLATPARYNSGEETERLAEELNIHSEVSIRKATAFMTVFNAVIDQDGDGDLAQDERESFVRILGFSTITASTNTDNTEEDALESHYRYANRDIIKAALANIEGQTATPYVLYQTRTNRNPSWKRYYVGATAQIPCNFGVIGIQMKLETDLERKESTMSFWIFPAEKSSPEKFEECLAGWSYEQDLTFDFFEGGYWFRGAKAPADDHDDIVRFFTEHAPKVYASIEKKVKG